MAKSSAKVKASSASVQAEIDRLEQDRAKAIADHLRLSETRERILLDGTDEDIRQHDELMAAALFQAERATLKRERLLPDLDEAHAAEAQAVKIEAYAAAKKKRDDGVAAMAEYEAAANALAKIARRIGAGTFAASEANRDLPDGYPPLDPPEPYNGTPSRPAEYTDETRRVAFDKRSGREVNGYNPDDPWIGYRWVSTGRKVLLSNPSPATPHRSFLHFLHIPGTAPDTIIF